MFVEVIAVDLFAESAQSQNHAQRLKPFLTFLEFAGARFFGTTCFALALMAAIDLEGHGS
jgi:hypothetical protein